MCLILNLAWCSQEEADSRMILHLCDAVQHGYMKAIIRTLDTDFVVLSIAVVHQIGIAELWLAFGTGKHYRYIAAHEIAAFLGPLKSKALPMFHALTGCDTTSGFASKGKKSAWDTWSVFPVLTDALLALASAPPHIPDECLAEIERFVVLLYSRSSGLSKVNEARRDLFSKARPLEHIPPTQSALLQHVKRSTLQGGHCWGQTLIAQPELPSPADWGWVKSKNGWTPLWSSLPTAAQACYELVSCGCKKACSGRCKCTKASFQCTALCQCGGTCYH